MKENPIWCIKLGLLWSADCHLDKDLDALMPWAYAQPAIASQ